MGMFPVKSPGLASIRLDNDDRFIFTSNLMSDANVPQNNLKISRYFAEVLNAPVVNKAWSWGSESQTSRVLFFRVWEDQIEHDQVQVYWPWGKDSNGSKERTRHLDLMRSGRPTFGVICTAVRTETHGEKRTIKRFDNEVFLRLGLPLKKKKDGVLWATIEERLAFEEMLKTSGTEAAAKDDVAAVNAEKGLDETTKQRLVDARLGQGKFRTQLFAQWDGRCAATGSTTSEALRASHILPWSKSDNIERLDAANGLLLNAGIDALFDRLVITFSDTGKMVVSKSVPASEKALLRLNGGKLRRPLTVRTKGYLARHREMFAKEEANRTAA